MDEGISEARSRVFPVAFVEDVIGVEMERDTAVLSAGCVACAEVEEVIAADADRVVARSFFAAGVAPARHHVQTVGMGHQDIGKECGMKARNVDDLLVVVRGCACVA